MKDLIITEVDNINKEGLTIRLNRPTSRNGGIKTDELWFSWDVIGEALFDDYTDKVSVEERNKLRED